MLRLERFAMQPDATWGLLWLPGNGQVIFTLERPWACNRPFVSCIPSGLYDLEPARSADHDGAWAIIGPGVSRYALPIASRYGCLIHAANFPHQVQGCIGVGDSMAMLPSDGENVLGVTNSRATLELIGAALRKMATPKLEVVNCGSVG